MDNTLYYGDNLDVLRRYIKDESVDLIYLDPPFKSSRDYNILFQEQNGTRAAAQIKAFEDTWHWDDAASRAYEETIRAGGRVADVMTAFHTFLGGNDMMAYLSMMAPRLVELRRVLKATGSIYLHCDPTASHYLKLLMDAVFGAANFRNEIVWRRAQPKSHTTVRMSRAHDVLLFYVKSEQAPYNQQYTEHDPEYVEKFYKFVEKGTGRRYRLGDLTNPNRDRPNLTYEFPPKSGTVRVWRWTKDRMMKAWKEGRVILPEKGKVVVEKRYLDGMEGTPVTDFWDDIEHLHGIHRGPDVKGEGLGYPTQKPEALLERIIKASSNEGDVVLDPFCGCGTAVAVAQKLNRRWIGIDITHLAITLIKKRLFDTFGIASGKGFQPLDAGDVGHNKGLKPLVEPLVEPLVKPLVKPGYCVIGEPVDISGARALAEEDKFQFQWWALGLVDARPVEQKKGADRGIDGRRYFIDGQDRHIESVIFSVKGGHVTVKDVRDLRGVIEREKAAIGVLISLEEPTRDMKREAASGGFYHSDYKGTEHPRIQIVTIEQLLEGVGARRAMPVLDLPVLAREPAADATFKKAPKAKRKAARTESLDFDKE